MKNGHARERQVKKLLEAEGWLVVRAAGSLGPVDLVAMKGCWRPRVIEVKANEGSPWMNFRGPERDAMRQIAIDAGADAFLCHWPSRKEPVWIPSSQWPKQLVAAA